MALAAGPISTATEVPLPFSFTSSVFPTLRRPHIGHTILGGSPASRTTRTSIRAGCIGLAAPFLDFLLLSSLYTMMAIGLTLTYKVTRVPNFAHAELVAVGSYAGVFAVNTWGRGLGEALLSAFFTSRA